MSNRKRGGEFSRKTSERREANTTGKKGGLLMVTPEGGSRRQCSRDWSIFGQFGGEGRVVC